MSDKKKTEKKAPKKNDKLKLKLKKTVVSKINEADLAKATGGLTVGSNRCDA